jgi:protein involved in polysaccharide export with SLBB domain
MALIFSSDPQGVGMSVSRSFRAIWMFGLIMAVCCLVPGALFGQTAVSRLDSLRLQHRRERRPLPSHGALMSSLDSLRFRRSLEAREGMEKEQVLERAVKPEEYVLGPGDEIVVSLWGEINRSYPLEITPEGLVLLPHVGEILVGQMTLEQAKKNILDRLSRRYKDVAISVSLSKVRRFRVFVIGAVNLPGTYTASAIDRVSMLVDLAGGFIPNASRRNIKVKRGDSTAIAADLTRFIAVGDLEDNPHLLDGDVVTVPFRVDSVGVFGAVNIEGYYELREGDRISDLVEMARGLRGDVFMERAELVRFLEDGKSTESFFIELAEAVEENDPGHDLILRPDDVLLVRRIPGWHPEHIIEVRGQVYYPGNYTIQQNKTTLSEVIERAGGLKPDASLGEAKVIRTLYGEHPDLEFERLKEIPLAEMSQDEYAYFKVKSKQLHEVIVVDFEKLFLLNDKSEDVLLKRSDIVEIPAVRKTVNVNGQVKAPGAVRYRSGEKLSYYITQAGGYAWNAHKNKIRVIKKSTGQWLKPSKVKRIEPGDTIWIPERPERNYWEFFKDFVRVAADVATVILVAQQVTQ